MAAPVAFVGFGLLIFLVELGFLVVFGFLVILVILVILGFLVVLVVLDFLDSCFSRFSSLTG